LFYAHARDRSLLSFPTRRSSDLVLGLLHDVGKYQPAFQRRIRGEAVRVEHSLCGALAAQEKYPMPVSLMLEYCIAGHHAGLPDRSEEHTSELQSRFELVCRLLLE